MFLCLLEFLHNLCINNSKYFFISQFIGLMIIKLINIYFLCSFHHSGPNEDFEENAKIFCTFYFILDVELIFSTIVTFNYNSFYRINIYENKKLILFSIIIILYLIVLISQVLLKRRFL